MNVLIVDDHKIIAEGIKEILLKNARISSVVALNNPKMVLPYLNSHKIDLIITDLNMPEINGIELIEKVQPLFQQIQFGVLSMYFNKKIITHLISLNVKFCLHKNVDSDELDSALENLHLSHSYIQKSIEFTYGNLDSLPFKNADDILHSFSKREIEVYKLIMKNYKSYEIADLLFVSINTIKAHRKSILKKTECNTIQELILLGLKLGFETA